MLTTRCYSHKSRKGSVDYCNQSRRIVKAAAKKTKIMDLDKSPTTTIDVDGEQLENVNNFVYLGSRIDADGKSSPDIRRRIAIAISKLNTMAPLWKSQSTELKWRTLKALHFSCCNLWLRGLDHLKDRREKDNFFRDEMLPEDTQNFMD